MSFPGAMLIVVVCAVMPWMAIRTARELRARRFHVTTRDVLISTIVSHGLVTLLAIWAAWNDSIGLFPRPSVSGKDVLAGAWLLVAAGVANVLRWQRLGPGERDEATWIRPKSARDLVLWACVSVLAGVSEEMIYRGALLGVLERATGSYGVAVGACVIAFVLGHWVQGRGAMIIITLFALAFHALVWFTGDLYTAIVVHALYDFAAGAALWAMHRRETRAE